MDKKTYVSVGVLLVLVIGLTVYWQFFAPNKSAKDQSAQVLDSQNQEDIKIITALHQFSNGKHIVAGQVDLPTPCHTIDHTVSVVASAPDQVRIAFVTTANDASLCAQVITSARYLIDFVASENAVITATWNGVPAQLNLIPAGAGDDLENFEVFIKG